MESELVKSNPTSSDSNHLPSRCEMNLSFIPILSNASILGLSDITTIRMRLGLKDTNVVEFAQAIHICSLRFARASQVCFEFVRV